MTESQQCVNLVKEFEGFKAAPYLDSAGISTIGYGTTKYPNGINVELSDDPITEEQATEYLKWYLDICATRISQLITADLFQCQFDALCSLSYNIGITSFANSILLKTINNDPNDLTNIQTQFMRWTYAKGVIINGLVSRRKSEYQLYSSNTPIIN